MGEVIYNLTAKKDFVNLNLETKMAVKTKNIPVGKIQWQAIEKKTGKLIAKDYDYSKLVAKVSHKRYKRNQILFNFELGKGTWIL